MKENKGVISAGICAYDEYAILEICLFLAGCSPATIGGPTVANVFFVWFRFIPTEVIRKKKSS